MRRQIDHDGGLVLVAVVAFVVGAAEAAGRCAAEAGIRQLYDQRDTEETRFEFEARFDRALRRQGIRLRSQRRVRTDAE